jgi:hypothetical protein
MKNHIITALAILLITNYFTLTTCIAQAPQGIPYQAIARNASGAAIANTAIKVRFSIRDSIATGAIKYQETHSPTTSALGLFSVNVGMGTVVSGTFSGINWGKNAKFLQVELNTTGGTTFTDLGTTQMMSVPYALYAGNTVAGASESNYYNKPSIYSQPSQGATFFYTEAVNYCFNLVESGYSDWRIPSIQEVEYLRDIVGLKLSFDYWTKSSEQQVLGFGNGVGASTFTTLNSAAWITHPGGQAPSSLPAICVR